MVGEIEDPELSRALTAALRAVRKYRRLSSREVACRMNMNLRTYQHFEAGRGRFNFQRLKDFAQASGSDLHGLIYAILVGDTNLAARGGDHGLVSIVFYSLKAFSARLGDSLSALEAREAITALDQAFSQMEEQLRERLGSRKDSPDESG